MCVWADQNTPLLVHTVCVCARAAFLTPHFGRYYERFDTIQNALLAVFRLATGSGWHEVMFLYWPCDQYGERAVPFFFLTFHFSFCIVFYNVLGGLIFAHYKQLAETKKQAIEKQKAKMIRKTMKKKRTSNARGRRQSTVPEMRLSARFWREAMEQQAGNLGADSFFDNSTPSGVSADAPPAGTSPGTRDSGKKHMQALYRQHLDSQLTHLNAQQSLSLFPHTANTIQYMAERLLKPNPGMRWDTQLIEIKEEARRSEARRSEARQPSVAGIRRGSTLNGTTLFGRTMARASGTASFDGARGGGRDSGAFVIDDDSESDSEHEGDGEGDGEADGEGDGVGDGVGDGEKVKSLIERYEGGAKATSVAGRRASWLVAMGVKGRPAFKEKEGGPGIEMKASTSDVNLF